MLDKESSTRLTLLRFPLIVGVVFIHAFASTVNFSNGVMGISQPNFVVDFIKNLISNGFARISVPLFFLMSGYLFFHGFEWSKENYFLKLKSRVGTLLIPFLFWNLATLLFIAIAQSIPATQIFFSSKNPAISTFNAWDYINAIVGINRSPIAFQFWFIKDLMILILFVPIIKIGIKFIPLPFLGLALYNWFFGGLTLFAPSSDAILFFSLGAYFGSTNKSLFGLDKFGWPILGSYLVLVVVDVLSINLSYNQYLHKTGILFGIIAVLFSSKLALKDIRLKSLLMQLSGASFFVFAVHEPTLTILRKISYKIINPESPLIIGLLYLLLPIIVIILAVYTYRLLARVVPGFTSIITGG